MKPESESAIAERADKHQKHATSPQFLTAIPPFQKALDRLVTPGYGYRAKLRALFQYRASWSVIHGWRSGYRNPPPWAQALVAHELALGMLAANETLVSTPGARALLALREIRAQKERGTSLGAPSPKRTGDTR